MPLIILAVFTRELACLTREDRTVPMLAFERVRKRLNDTTLTSWVKMIGGLHYKASASEYPAQLNVPRSTRIPPIGPAGFL